ncbi:tyrosine-type recombinase/integrase [Micromonospora aurantiaca (nom. illeg.)]|uniref:tyrosine-type recombinase/integrase n=1 Tax=Micromonospora aurantiaca (nom. illeg.) TaxID=47850 RepID=UPI001656BD94|nr:site-specific integrase [Micromonospora aurantiaca]MBC9006974.1 tyrosine-type recombinase/integrase [Micromonospora aurantiaca]
MAWVEKRGAKFRVRLRMPDGTVTTDSLHERRADAVLRAKEVDVELARDTFIDPRGGRIALADWVPIWESTHQASPATWAAYRSHLRLHILPTLGQLPLVDIRRQHVKTLAVALGERLSPRSVADVIMVLSMVLQEAVEDRRLPFNPCRGVRIPKGIRAERPHATAAQVAAIIARQARPSDGLMILTAAYTGMRWGEVSGLARGNLDLTAGTIYVHPEVGALHEVEGKLFLGPPKTNDSVRHIRLPRFLTNLLAAHLAEHPHDIVFPGARGYHQRRSNFNRRAWAPAVAGDPKRGIPPILPGMHFHDLRHTHKTWLIEDGIPEIAQARRLGHRLGGVRGIYSHVTEAMHHQLVDALQRRWETTQTDRPTSVLRRLRDVA